MAKTDDTFFSEVRSLLSKVTTIVDFKGDDVYTPTNIKVLDKILHGGFYSGKIHLLAGLPHTGKSSLALQVAKSHLDKFDKSIVIYFDSENSVRKTRIEMFGIPLNRFFLSAYDVTLERIFSTIENLIEFKINKNMIDIPFLIIWDTLAFTPSEVLLNKELQNTDDAKFAMILKKLLIKYLGALNKYNIQLLVLNQLREKIINQPLSSSIDIDGLKYNMPGGSALKFAGFSFILFTNAYSKIDELNNKNKKDLEKSIEGKLSRLKTINATVLKNKAGDTKLSVKLVFDRKYGFSSEWSSFVNMLDLNMINESRGWYSIGDQKFRLADFIEKLKSDENFRKIFLELEEQMLNRLER